MWKSDLINQIDEMEDEIVDFLVKLIKIPTENPPGKNYEEFTEVLGRKLEEFNYDNIQYFRVTEDKYDEFIPSNKDDYPRVNLYAQYNTENQTEDEEPVLHFNGHMDVVPAEGSWSVNPFGGEIKDGKVYGRGSSDMKSGLVAQIFAIEAFRRAGYKLDGNVEQSAVVDEETVGNKNAGMYYLVDKNVISKENTDHVVITECLDPDRICIGHRGALRFQVETKGKQSHGGMPYSGVNAVDKMAKFLTAIEHELRPRLKDRVTLEPVVPNEAKRSSISVGTIEGGEAINLVPSKCTASFDRRLNPEESLKEGREEFFNILEGLSQMDPEFEYSVEEKYAANPVKVSKDQEIVNAFVNSINHQFDGEADYVLSPGTDDQRFVVQEAGIQSCIVYGPGRLDQAHVIDEHIEIEDLISGVKTMALGAGELLGVSKS